MKKNMLQIVQSMLIGVNEMNSYDKDGKCIIHGDCLDEIPKLNNDSIQLVVTSPHYFSAEKKYQRGTGFHYTHYVGEPIFDILNFMEALKPKMKDRGIVCLNLGWSSSQGGFLRLCEILLNIARRTGWFMPDIVFWEKPNPIPTQGRFTNCFEVITIWSKYPDYEFQKKVTYLKNIINASVKQGTGNTSKPFPNQIPEFFIDVFTKENDVVLDPFSGSGTVGLVAKKMNRRYIGIDIELRNIEYQKTILSQKVIENYE